MFRRLAAQIPNGAQALVSLHPAELSGLLEQAWNLRLHVATDPLGHPNHRSDVPGIGNGLPIPVLTPPNLSGGAPGPAAPFTEVLDATTQANPPGVRSDHLIYAAMIENTFIYEIFRRVVHEFLHGEKLGVPSSPETQLWLRSTEELFYGDPPLFSITNVSSHIRPDLRASRRNAYQRMFGMDLNPLKGNTPYPYTRAEAANNEFVPTFEELLKEVRVAYINRSTTSGANPTDNARIEDLTRKLHDMLLTRRQTGNLSREEFFFVSMMSWFHLTVDNDLQIITDLRATGSSPEQRLFKIASAVGFPAHGLSRSYFQIAEAISAVLIAIETGSLNAPGAARAFYDPAAANTLADVMNTIINHWNEIIPPDRDIKEGKVAVR